MSSDEELLEEFGLAREEKSVSNNLGFFDSIQFPDGSDEEPSLRLGKPVIGWVSSEISYVKIKNRAAKIIKIDSLNGVASPEQARRESESKFVEDYFDDVYLGESLRGMQTGNYVGSLKNDRADALRTMYKLQIDNLKEVARIAKDLLPK